MSSRKKIKGSTLMETLVATVLIVVVFMTASMVLNNLFSSSIQMNDNEVRQELLRLQYKHENGLLQLPYFAELGDWEVRVSEVPWQNGTQVLYEAHHRSGTKEIIVQR